MRRRICVRLAKVGQFHGAPYNVLLNVNCLPPPLYVQITPSVSTFEFSPPLSESTYLATSMSSTTGVDPLTSPVRNIWHGDFLRRHHRVHRWWGCGGVRKKFTTTLPKPTVVRDGYLEKLLFLNKEDWHLRTLAKSLHWEVEWVRPNPTESDQIRHNPT